MSVLTNQTIECEKRGTFEKNPVVGVSVVIPVTERCDDLTQNTHDQQVPGQT